MRHRPREQPQTRPHAWARCSTLYALASCMVPPQASCFAAQGLREGGAHRMTQGLFLGISPEDAQQALGGFYKDYFHRPKPGEHSVGLEGFRVCGFPQGSSDFTFVGSDTGVEFFSAGGNVVEATEEGGNRLLTLHVDFRRKGGPGPNFAGNYTSTAAKEHKDGRIHWEDGNVWFQIPDEGVRLTLANADDASAASATSDLQQSLGGFYVDPKHHPPASADPPPAGKTTTALAGVRVCGFPESGNKADLKDFVFVGADGPRWWRARGQLTGADQVLAQESDTDREVDEEGSSASATASKYGMTMHLEEKGGPPNFKGEWGRREITWTADGNLWTKKKVEELAFSGPNAAAGSEWFAEEGQRVQKGKKGEKAEEAVGFCAGEFCPGG